MLTADATQPADTQLRFAWAVTGGRLDGKGRSVTWDLNGIGEGAYTATVEVNDGNGLTASTSTTVTVAPCSDCRFFESPCPVVLVSCPSSVESKHEITFVASFFGRDPDLKPTYTWSITAGKIISGQGTARITVDASDISPQSLTATVTLGGIHPLCSGNVASCSVERLVSQR